ncbi:MAG: substrate-binding domain-containing protein [Clostridium sp.]|uniref:substrate-binding domain-containing protein n=1 Tax=Clostridium sp. TaxID=1506 RepID=UPI003D6CE9C2
MILVTIKFLLKSLLGVIKAIYQQGIKVPQELSMIGFDNIGVSEIARPALSIIVQPMEEVGKLSVQLLLKRIKGDCDSFPTINLLKTNLIIKDSTRKL